MSFTPTADRLLVTPIEPKDALQGGIYVPGAASLRIDTVEATVVALGGKVDKESGFKKGTKVLVSRHGAMEIKVDGVRHLLVGADDILAILG